MMPAYEIVKCPDCGEEVSMHPMAQKKHKRECKMSPIEENTNTVKPVVATQATEIDAADEATRELYRLALNAQEKRKQAPELFVAGMHSDERKELIARYAPECVDPVFQPYAGKAREFAEYHACYCPANKAQLYANKGYVPVLDENKLHVQHEGDLLFKIPRNMWLHKELTSSNESRIRREGQTDAETEQLGADGGDGTTVESSRKTEILK